MFVKKLDIMKTITTKSTIQNRLSITGKLFILIMISSLSLLSQSSSKSPYLLGLSVGSHISGNSHGTIFEAGANLYNGKNSFSLGACVQKRSMELCGGRFNYTRILTGKEDLASGETAYSTDPSKVQLFFYTRVEYLNNAQLCYNAIKKEETLVKNKEENGSDINNVRLSTIDVSAGIGLNVKISKKFVLANYIGFGTFYHLNYKPGMYCDKIAPVLVLGTSIKLNCFAR